MNQTIQGFFDVTTSWMNVILDAKQLDYHCPKTIMTGRFTTQMISRAAIRFQSLSLTQSFDKQ